jgi:hypothetical protein
MNFLKLLRPNKNVISNTLLNTARGAKRKGEKKEAGVLSEHVLNVWKNAPEDVAILPDQYYPKWVLDLPRETMKLEEMYGNAILGVTVRIFLLLNRSINSIYVLPIDSFSFRSIYYAEKTKKKN